MCLNLYPRKKKDLILIFLLTQHMIFKLQAISLNCAETAPCSSLTWLHTVFNFDIFYTADVNAGNST